MNLKLLFIIFLVMLIVLMSYLNIVNCNNNKENFQAQCTIDCSVITDANVCNGNVGNCRIFEDSCRDICRFNPSQATDDNYLTFGMNRRTEDDNTIYFFKNDNENERQSDCIAKCTEINTNQNIDNSFCSPQECINKCEQYVESRTIEEKANNIRYINYPTNRVAERDYEKIKQTLISNMVQGKFKDEIQDQIFQDRINSEIASHENLDDEAQKLNNIMLALKNLNLSGNSFVQQIGQLGDFQDKYSQKLQELLTEKDAANNSMDYRLAALNNKLETLNELYKDFSTLQENKQVSFNEITHFKSGTCLANGKTINFMPVTYVTEDGNKYYKNGVYCIKLLKTLASGNTLDGIVFVEPKKNDPNNTNNELYCNPSNINCSYKLSIKPPSRTDPTNSANTADDVSQINIEASENIQQQTYPEEGSSQDKFLLKKQAYFHIVQIRNNDEYNGILIKLNNNNLINNQQINYPFYVIESLELPGHLVNIKKRSDRSGFKLTVEPANGVGTEKFRISTENYTENDSAVCLS